MAIDHANSYKDVNEEKEKIQGCEYWSLPGINALPWPNKIHHRCVSATAGSHTRREYLPRDRDPIISAATALKVTPSSSSTNQTGKGRVEAHTNYFISQSLVVISALIHSHIF